MCWREGGRIRQVEKQGRASVDRQGSPGAGRMQTEAGSQASVPSISQCLGTDYSGRVPPWGEGVCSVHFPCWRKQPPSHLPKVGLEHIVSPAWKGPLSFSSAELQCILQVQVHVSFPLALKSADRDTAECTIVDHHVY